MASLMAVSATSVILPAALHASLRGSAAHSEENILILSRGTALTMLAMYCLYLVFRLRTHAGLFDEEEYLDANESGDMEPRICGPLPAVMYLLVVIIGTALCAEYLIDSMHAIVGSGHVTKTFLGLVLLPFLGNASQHIRACILAYHDDIDAAIAIPVISSMQIALFVTIAARRSWLDDWTTNDSALPDLRDCGLFPLCADLSTILPQTEKATILRASCAWAFTSSLSYRSTSTQMMLAMLVTLVLYYDSKLRTTRTNQSGPFESPRSRVKG